MVSVLTQFRPLLQRLFNFEQFFVYYEGNREAHVFGYMLLDG